MKKIIALLLLVTILTLGFTSCGEPDNTQIRIGYLTGPTGMGMAKLIHDNGGVTGNEQYVFERFDAPAKATAALAAGKVDLICVATNDAAAYYNENENIEVLAINTLSSLFLVTDENTTINAFSELSGKTIYTCKAGTPKPIIEYLVSISGVNATVSDSFDGKVIASPAELGALLTEGSLDIAVVPEPILTSSLMTIKTNGNTDIQYSIDLPVSEVWNTYAEGNAPLAMGCIVGNKDFIEAHSGIVEDFLNEYKKSIEFIDSTENLTVAAEYIAEAKIMGAAKPAEAALKNLHGSIAYIDGNDMKDALIAFYNALEINLPKDEFYYEK